MFTYSVSELCQHSKNLLESEFPDIWVKGEISNIARPASGHIYFSLKDDFAQIRCALFRSHALRLKFSPEDGNEVLIHGKVSLYVNRGDFQLICDDMQPIGVGALQLAFEQLKEKLQKEGLFDLERKKSIPKFPSSIGVISSASGAAIRDILVTLNRRFSFANVVIYPSLVQGTEASKQLLQNIKIANKRNECDVLILARGGGSIEDLWAFNNEELARAITTSKIPVISGIGHENDFTIADFVADLRASTPTAAAEAATPDCEDLYQYLDGIYNRLFNTIDEQTSQIQVILSNLTKRFMIPKMYFSSQYSQLEKFQLQLNQIQSDQLKKYSINLQKINVRLSRNTLPNQLLNFQHSIQSLTNQIQTLFNQQLRDKRLRLEYLAKQSHSLSPMPTLSRGYSIISKKDNKEVISSIDKVNNGDIISNKVIDGIIISEVIETDNKTI